MKKLLMILWLLPLLVQGQCNTKNSVKYYGAKGDGIHDDTYAIQVALNSGEPTLFFPKGTYLIDPFKQSKIFGTWIYYFGINIPGNIKIDLQGSVLKSKPINGNKQYGDLLTIMNASNVQIINGIIEGEKNEHIGDFTEHDHGIRVGNSDNVIFNNLTIRDFLGDCIIIDKYYDRQDEGATDIKILNCHLSGSRRQGVSIITGARIFIDNCEITGIGGTSPGYGIDAETDYPEDLIKYVTVSNSYFEGNAGGGIVLGRNTRYFKIRDCVFKKNNISLIKDNEDTEIISSVFEGTYIAGSKFKRLSILNNIFTNSSFVFPSETIGYEFDNLSITGNKINFFDVSDREPIAYYYYNNRIFNFSSNLPNKNITILDNEIILNVASANIIRFTSSMWKNIVFSNNKIRILGNVNMTALTFKGQNINVDDNVIYCQTSLYPGFLLFENLGEYDNINGTFCGNKIYMMSSSGEFCIVSCPRVSTSSPLVKGINVCDNIIYNLTGYNAWLMGVSGNQTYLNTAFNNYLFGFTGVKNAQNTVDIISDNYLNGVKL